MRRLIPIFLLFLPCLAWAQEIETYYYNKENRAVNQVFASYYRVISVPSEISPDKMFRDFYMSGKVRGEGNYLTIDKANADNSVLDGECTFYHEDGSLWKKFRMEDGKLDGPYIEFTEKGDEFVQYDYVKGILAHDWYYRSSITGAYGRFRIGTNEPIIDEFDPAAQYITWIDGTPWLSYNVNGVTVSMAVRASNEYGSYHEISVVIDNTSYKPIVIDPKEDFAAYAARFETAAGSKDNPRAVLSYDDYMTKVNNRHAWESIMLGLTSAAYAVSNAFSPDSFSVSLNGTTAYVNTYGNNISITYPNLWFAGLSETWMKDRKVIQRGYLKKNTISSGEVVSGYFNVIRNSEPYLSVSFKFGDTIIPFYWDVSSEIARPIDASDLILHKEGSTVPTMNYASNKYNWRSANEKVSVLSVNCKKQTKIYLLDLSGIYRNREIVLRDADGDHVVSSATKRVGDLGDETMIVSDAVIKFPFSIIVSENPVCDILDINCNQ